MLGMNTYFNFMGNTREAMTFYKGIFGGEFTSLQQFKDMPGFERFSPKEQEMIMHITLTTPKGHVLMATDVLESMEQKVTFGNNSYICVHTESEAETDKIFNGLSAGGTIEMPVNKTFWGAYCGMCKDQYGVQWMITHTYPTK